MGERIEMWTRNFLAHYAWRVGREYDLDDLYEEALIIWLKVQARYGGKVSEEHLANIYGASVRNRLFSLARRSTKRRRVDAGAEENQRQISRVVDPEWSIRTVVADASLDFGSLPEWVRRYVSIRAFAGSDIKYMKLCRTLGLHPPSRKELRRMLREQLCLGLE